MSLTNNTTLLKMLWRWIYANTEWTLGVYINMIQYRMDFGGIYKYDSKLWMLTCILHIHKCFLPLWRMVEWYLPKFWIGISMQQSFKFKEWRSSWWLVLPSEAHEFIQLVWTIFWSFHDTTINHIPQNLIVWKALEEIFNVTCINIILSGRYWAAGFL